MKKMIILLFLCLVSTSSLMSQIIPHGFVRTGYNEIAMNFYGDGIVRTPLVTMVGVESHAIAFGKMDSSIAIAAAGISIYKNVFRIDMLAGENWGNSHLIGARVWIGSEGIVNLMGEYFHNTNRELSSLDYWRCSITVPVSSWAEMGGEISKVPFSDDVFQEKNELHGVINIIPPIPVSIGVAIGRKSRVEAVLYF